MRTAGHRTVCRGLAALLLAGVALAACTDQEAGVGGVGTGGGQGRVDGFGSVIVEGQRLDDAQALVAVDVNPAAPAPAPLTAVQLGAQIETLAERGALVRGTVGSEVFGQIRADVPDGATEFTLLGQRVLLDAHPAIRPVFDGVNDLLAGTMLEVHGMRRANGDIVATRLQVRNPGDRTARIAGEVAGLDLAARRFVIGAMSVNYAGAAVIPAGAVPMAGQRVTVFADRSMVAGNVINAQVLRIEKPLAGEDHLRVTGFVTQFSSTAQFRVRGLRVDARGAAYAAGSAADLRNDQLLRVSGRMSGGVLQASEIKLLRTAADAPINVSGAVTDVFDTGSPFRMRGANVRIATGAALIGGGTANLGNGVLLKVEGEISNGDVLATRLEWVEISPVIAGPVSSYDATGGTLRIEPRTRLVRLAAGTTFRNGVAADLANGRSVRISGQVSADEFNATEVTFLDSPAAPPLLLLAGVSSDPQIGDRIFVNDAQVLFNPQTIVTGGPTGTAADLDGGYFVVVRAVKQGPDLVARSIEIKRAIDENASHVLGYVTEFTSAGEFRAAGQRVRATGAQISGGVVADLRNNAYLLVEGAMDNGVLIAARIDLLPH